jgi:hypothetical protein
LASLRNGIRTCVDISDKASPNKSSGVCMCYWYICLASSFKSFIYGVGLKCGEYILSMPRTFDTRGAPVVAMDDDSWRQCLDCGLFM